MRAIKVTPPKGIAALGHALLALALAAAPANAARSGGSRAIVPDFAFMTGSWTDDGDCTHAARLDADGRFHTAQGAGGLWVMDGGRLILTGSSTLTMRIVPIDRNTVTVFNTDGSNGRSIRCGSPGARPAAVRLDRAYLVGRWTDDGDCTSTAEFRADGRFIAATGTQGTWRLDGNRMTMAGSSTMVLGLVVIDRNTINIVNPDGSVGRSTRC